MLALSFFSIKMLAATVIQFQSFWHPSSSLTWCAGPRTLHKWRVAIQTSAGDPGTVILAHISKPTGARDFNFAGSVVQRSVIGNGD